MSDANSSDDVSDDVPSEQRRRGRKLRAKAAPVAKLPGDLVATALRPTVQNAMTLEKIDATIGRKLLKGGHENLPDFVAELVQQTKLVCKGDLDRGEGMLAAQAHTLDALFNALTSLAVRNFAAQFIDAGETFLRLALKAQGQCRATWEAVSAIQNPPIAGYVKQANIAQNQQVNNGQAPPSRTGDPETPQNKLLEATTHESDQWLVGGPSAAAAPGDSALAAVEKVDGTEDGGR